MSFYGELNMETKQQIVHIAEDLKETGLNPKQIADKLCMSESMLRRIKKDVTNASKQIG